ncbi:MAG: glycosyltransferase [Bacteroidota bacterium]|jgi:glycosyltransferase involved in cell wall biosynthesis
MLGTSQVVTYILGSFPNGIQPFVFNELKELSRLGFNISVFSVYGSPHHSDDEQEWISRTVYAEPLFSPKIILSHLYFIITKPSTYFFLLGRYRSFRGKMVFWKSAYFAREVIKRDIKHIHAHFAWVAADSARLISKLTGITYSLTAHQSDINRYADDNLYKKLKDAKFIFTCTKGNKEYLGNKFGKEIYNKTTSIYHGVDIEQFKPGTKNGSPNIDILSIGSLIKIKGFDHLVKACAILKSKGITHSCLIIGKGSEKEYLEELIANLNLKDTIEIKEHVPYYKISEYYYETRIFVLPVVVIDGAPHGIPNVLAEAMSMELPVISTNVPDIPELIENGRDGILVDEKDPKALADVIESLLKDNNRCMYLGKMAREKTEREFDSRQHVQRIAEKFCGAGYKMDS